jgi:hypothetical protein
MDVQKISPALANDRLILATGTPPSVVISALRSSKSPRKTSSWSRPSPARFLKVAVSLVPKEREDLTVKRTEPEVGSMPW